MSKEQPKMRQIFNDKGYSVGFEAIRETTATIAATAPKKGKGKQCSSSSL
jgi:hypothetical protein